jgi:hypothetical protein
LYFLKECAISFQEIQMNAASAEWREWVRA